MNYLKCFYLLSAFNVLSMFIKNQTFRSLKSWNAIDVIFIIIHNVIRFLLSSSLLSLCTTNARAKI